MDNVKAAEFDPVKENERKHRIIYAIIVFILLGTFTIVERFVFFYKDNLGVVLGLTCIDTLEHEWFSIASGIVLGILFIVAAVFLGFHRIWLPAAAVVWLIIDLVIPVIQLLNTMVKDSLPLIVIIAIRIACVKWLSQGVMAVYQRQQNAKKAMNNSEQTNDSKEDVIVKNNEHSTNIIDSYPNETER